MSCVHVTKGVESYGRFKYFEEIVKSHFSRVQELINNDVEYIVRFNSCCEARKFKHLMDKIGAVNICVNRYSCYTDVECSIQGVELFIGYWIYKSWEGKYKRMIKKEIKEELIEKINNF